MTLSVPCPYQYDSLRQVRPWVIAIKRFLLQSHLAPVTTRWRGRRELSEYTGGWNTPANKCDLSQRRLNLGGGQTNYIGYINLDVVPTAFAHVQAVGQKLPFENRAFDEVLCVDVIEHLDRDDAEDMLSEILRVLRDGGHLVLVTPDLDDIVRSYRSGFATQEQVLQHLLGDKRDHRYIYTAAQLSHILQLAGLRIERVIQHWGPIWAHTVLLAER